MQVVHFLDKTPEEIIAEICDGVRGALEAALERDGYLIASAAVDGEQDEIVIRINGGVGSAARS